MSEISGADMVFSRVIAAVDASGLDAIALHRVLDLASRLDVEAGALFIEDANLFRLAGLPMVRHLTLGAQTTSPFTAERLEGELRDLASRVASKLETAATRRGIRWSFRVVRGLPSVEVTAATMNWDLVVVGCGRNVYGMPLRLQLPLSSAVLRAGRSILLAGQRTRLTRPLAVVCDGSPSRALAAAARFSEPGSELTALIVGVPSETSEAAAPAELPLLARSYRSRQIKTLTQAELIRAIREGGHDLLVLPANVAWPVASLENLMSEASCDVLVVQ